MDGAEIYFTVNNHVPQSFSYRPREMSSKKPVSRLRQVIPVKKQVSDIAFALTYTVILKLNLNYVHAIDELKF